MALSTLARRWRQWLTRRPQTVEDLQTFWRKPNWPNRPEAYLSASPARSLIISEILIRKGIPKTARILELGCNAGRNLLVLAEFGYTYLEGIEISPDAVMLARRTATKTGAPIAIDCGALEELLPSRQGNTYDVIFTMAVLEHIHPRSIDTVLNAAVHCLKPGGLLITVEDESSQTRRHFPRNYRVELTDRGLVQIESKAAMPLGLAFRTRVFRKPGAGGRGRMAE